MPNPLFLRHTAAIAGFYVALYELGPDVGLRLGTWRRDEGSWEDWTHYQGPGRLRPDAYAEVTLSVDDQDGTAGMFLEVDFATMDHARLRAKVARHRRYCQETVWWDRHPCCPALLLVTTSDVRASRFLASAEKDRPRPLLYQDDDPYRYRELVAACAAVASPEASVSAPVWRASVGDAPVTLSKLLAPEVRQYRAVLARVAAARQAQARDSLHHRADNLRSVVDELAPALGDPEAAMAAHFVLGTAAGWQTRQRWADLHPDMVDQTTAWWASSERGVAPPPPAALVAAWKALYRSSWLAQVDALLADSEAVRLGDPRLVHRAAELGAGRLLPRRRADKRPGGRTFGARAGHGRAPGPPGARRG